MRSLRHQCTLPGTCLFFTQRSICFRTATDTVLFCDNHLHREQMVHGSKVVVLLIVKNIFCQGIDIKVERDSRMNSNVSYLRILKNIFDSTTINYNELMQLNHIYA